MLISLWRNVCFLISYVITYLFYKNKMIDVKYKLEGDGIVPTYMTDGSVGADLFAAQEVVSFGQILIVDTGVSIEIPEGYEGQIRPRSSLLPNRFLYGPIGTIDQDYRGTLKVVLLLLNPRTITTIEKGERIVQLVISPIVKANFIPGELSSTARNEGGFGSTGR